ncbi:uncharacterized protein AB675_2989 [Cyphellophora attinorum]|uniref:NmrA-like domain-containing protein n=1 Tax=Cyphellophora attinorum TaxID=1664694 RepID=A0A0N0NIZ9_9EURO|nr:uncharacterized protein AB675_2989 [Phialophora attinorum]KPI36411.1 hypothetical protein AB675_2989 [Phialophora attinorum]
MSGLFAVLGATGTQGSSVIRYHVVFIRQALRDQGIEVVQADVDDEQSLAIAFKVSKATLPWGYILQLELIASPNKVCHHHLRRHRLLEPWAKYFSTGHADPWKAALDDEVRRGKNIISAAERTLDTLKHFIFSSLPSPEAVSSGKFANMPHYDGKVQLAQQIHASASQASGQKTLGDITTEIWATYYMENFIRFELNAYLRPRKVNAAVLESHHFQSLQTSSSDSPHYILSTPQLPSTQLALLASEADFGAFVAPLISRKPSPKTPVLAVSQRLTFPEICAVLSKQIGVEIKYQQAADRDYEAKYGSFGVEFERMYHFYDEFGYCGDTPTVGLDELNIKTVSLTPFKDFVAKQKWDGFLVE